MNTKTLILLGGFLFTLSALFAQRLQEGLSIGMPALSRVFVGQFYYNLPPSSDKIWEDLQPLAPGYMLTYAFTGNGKDQWFVRHSAYMAAFVDGYFPDAKPWDFPELFLFFGGGRTHYFSFAPFMQWQWETGLHVDRLWEGVGWQAGNPKARTDWKIPQPYFSLRLQTTAIGKHLVLGLAASMVLHDDFHSFVDELMLTSYASWDIKARSKNVQKKVPPLSDELTPLSVQLYDHEFVFSSRQSYRYSTRLTGLHFAYWWGTSDKLRWGNRLGLGLGFFGNSPLADDTDRYEWMVQAEQNLYWRFAERSPILPFAGLGLTGGQVVETVYGPSERRFVRRAFFRPYAQLGLRLHRPHHRLFWEFAFSSFPSTHVGLGIRFNKSPKLSP